MKNLEHTLEKVVVGGKFKAVEEKNEEKNFHGGGWGETESTIPRSEQGSPLTK